MGKVALIAAIAVSACAMGVPARAMPLLRTGATDTGIVQAAEGCGPGGHRGPYGRCVPNYRRPVYRGCPPGTHPGGYGRCRPNY